MYMYITRPCFWSYLVEKPYPCLDTRAGLLRKTCPKFNLIGAVWVAKNFHLFWQDEFFFLRKLCPESLHLLSNVQWSLCSWPLSTEATLSNNGINLCRYYYQCVYFFLSPKATSLKCGQYFVANRVTLLERDCCTPYTNTSELSHGRTGSFSYFTTFRKYYATTVHTFVLTWLSISYDRFAKPTAQAAYNAHIQ